MASPITNAPLWLRNHIRREFAFVRGRYDCERPPNPALHRGQLEWLHAEPSTANSSAPARASAAPKS